MKWTISSADYLKLARAVYAAFAKAFFNIQQSEPQLIANLVWQLPNFINSVTLIGSTSIRSGAIFVHSQPFVSCGNFPSAKPDSVEIGDLLLLRTTVQAGTVTCRKALLLQAKKFTSFPVLPDNVNQHHLYAYWPDFVYKRSTKALNLQKRKIQGMDLYNGAKYLLIGNNSSYAYFGYYADHILQLLHARDALILTAQPTYPHLSHHQYFIQELIDFILGDAGKSYVRPAQSGSLGWDQVIDDLISITANQFTKYISNASGMRYETRGQFAFLAGSFQDISVLSEVATQLNINTDGPPLVPDERMNGNGSDNSGISIIEFIVKSNEKASTE